MKVTYIIRSDGACDFYRLEQPISFARKLSPEDKFHKISEAQISVAAQNDDPKILDKLMDADVIVMPRLWGIKPMHLLKQLNPHAKIVLEYDDNLFCISPLSPHYVDHGTEEIHIQLPGESEPRPIWVDGQNIDIQGNRLRAAETIMAMKEADLITTTTEHMANVLREFNPNVAVLKNSVNLDLWRKLPLKPHDGLRMGWFGGSSHYEDWCLLTDVLPKIMRRHPQLTLVIMGVKFDGTLRDVPKDRIEFHPWVPTPAYPYKSAILDLDFAVIPLQDTDFNRCKSAIKLLEMGALGVPSVVSHVSPYKELAEEWNGVWIEDNSESAWFDGISLMASDAKVRATCGMNARKMVERGFDASKTAHSWINAYKEANNAKIPVIA